MRRSTVAVGVFGVVCLIGGTVVYRTTSDPPPDPPAAAVPATPIVPPPTAAAGDAPDHSDPDDADGEVVPSATSPPPGSGFEVPVDPSGARTVATADGARQSVVDYVSTVRQRLAYMTDSSARAVLSAWIAPGAAPTLVESELAQAAAVRDVLSATGGGVWWLVTPLATRLDAIDGDRARVSVWLASIAASGPNPTLPTAGIQPMVRFQTDTVEIVWSDDGWQVWSITSIDGPTPMTTPSAQIATVDTFLAGLDGYRPMRSHQ